MTVEERIAVHRRMAGAYRNAYLRQGVQDGEAFVDPFLDVAIGVHGPFRGTSEYVEALERCLATAGVSI